VAIRGSEPDIVHSNGLKMHVMGARAVPSGVPLIWHIHDFVTMRPLMRRLLASQVRHCAEAIAVSHSVADDARRTLGASLRVTTIHNAIETERFVPDGPRLDLDRLAGLAPAEDGTVRIGMIGTMARWKGHQIFLRALTLLRNRPPVRAYVIGGPVYETGGSQYSLEELAALAGRYNLTGHVGFTGFVADVPAALRALDIVVHASTEPEPFGLVIAEAMACGRAVIVSNAGGATELIEAGNDALTYQPGDHAMLADVMAKLIENRELRQSLGRAARESAVCRFGRERLARELRPVYERLRIACQS
jgi:glycosyltransferase involved in cell wall biosynthesis